MNDLTIIEGVGPKIAELCVQRGITTWWSLANCDLDVLRTMLAEAGPKFQVHDPTTWPHQARLLANGQWQKFKTLADALRAERFGE
jgi:predicted flap endonuclease-1-like 5' DNA nuclease